MAKRKLISLDFDGVLHAYTSGWQGAGLANDAPVPGALDFLRRIVEDDRFDTVISSSRCDREEGREAIRTFLDRHLVEEFGEVVGLTVSAGIRVGDGTKPPAYLHVDDRCMRFDGTWPSLDEIDAFKPWNKRDDIVAAAAAAGWKASPAPLHAVVCGIPETTSSDPDLAARVREVLEPFAAVADYHDGQMLDDDHVVHGVKPHDGVPTYIRLRDVRAAQALLRDLAQEDDGHSDDLAEISSRVIETATAQTVADVPATRPMALHACDCGKPYFAPEPREACPECAAAASVKRRYAFGTNADGSGLELFFIEKHTDDASAKSAALSLLQNEVYREEGLRFCEIESDAEFDLEDVPAGLDVLVEVGPEVIDGSYRLRPNQIVRVVAVFEEDQETNAEAAA
ncbi:hypothetical protein SAMN06297251_10168 [Fulvimarina manganoxydans]|uniref:Uncharacterized protein n=1 Tax=Fulvimarina manganoxydans TaxID=937218 RepID=A0A1W1Y939_9HYPH|nr:HAD domain-containing protein [Fulvimarina manganoxydans]SMC32677.1 hypothetical protein SAMN06297251_10168 [Fulvimarina manganoxydans]